MLGKNDLFDPGRREVFAEDFWYGKQAEGLTESVWYLTRYKVKFPLMQGRTITKTFICSRRLEAIANQIIDQLSSPLEGKGVQKVKKGNTFSPHSVNEEN